MDSLKINSLNSSTVTSPAGATTSVPPFNSGAQISKVEASNEIGAYCKKTVFSSIAIKLVFCTKRVTLRWHTSMPLGNPVEPDVNMRYAACAPPAGCSIKLFLILALFLISGKSLHNKMLSEWMGRRLTSAESAITIFNWVFETIYFNLSSG